MTHATTVTVISNTAPRSSVETPPALPDLTIGIDLGDRHSDLCAIERGGEILEESRLQTTPRAFRQRFSSMPPARIAIEVGTHSPWVQALSTELGHEVVVANPRKLQAIYKSNRKCDRRDAEQLARPARSKAPVADHPSRYGDACRPPAAASRAALVDARTQLVNHVRGSCKPFGGASQPARRLRPSLGAWRRGSVRRSIRSRRACRRSRWLSMCSALQRSRCRCRRSCPRESRAAC